MSGEPLFAGTIHGVRTWRVEEDLTLRGLGIGSAHAWSAGGFATIATCLRGTHPAPHPDCGCGLYGLHPFTPVHKWIPLDGEGPVTGLVEAWGRVELHQAGFRAERARPKALFAPARHLVPAGYLETVREVSARYRVPVVDLPRPEHAREWCRLRGLGLAPETIEDSFLEGLAIRLRRRRRFSVGGNRLTIGVWPERDPPVGLGWWREPLSRADHIPGITVCRVTAQDPAVAAVLEEPRFDPGRRLRLFVRENGGGRELVEVWDEHGELRLGPLSPQISSRIAAGVRSGRLSEVRALSRTLAFRGSSAGERWLNVLIAPRIPISVEPEEAEPPTLPGWDWFDTEPGLDS